jgi:hypothetical protein
VRDLTTNIEIGAGEKIMLRYLTNLYKLKGMWFDKPGRAQRHDPGQARSTIVLRQIGKSLRGCTTICVNVIL